MNRSLIIFFLLFAVNTQFAQGFRIRGYYPGSIENISKNIFETSKGNYFATGIIVEKIANANVDQLIVMGYDSIGQLKWSKKYGNSNFIYYKNDFTSRALYKSNGYIYYPGCVRNNQKDIGVLIKFNFNGDTIWQKTYRDSTKSVVPQMVTRSVDGGFLIVGFLEDWVNSTRPIFILKTDSNGVELWRNEIHKAGKDGQDGKGIIQDSASKKIAIVGYQYKGSTLDIYDNIIIADSLGNKISQHSFGDAGGNLFDLIQTKDKALVAVGVNITSTLSGAYQKTYSYILKFDINNPAQPIWKVDNFDRLSLGNSISSVIELPNGEIVTGGILDTMMEHDYSLNVMARITKFSTTGQILSNRYYDYSDPAISKKKFNMNLNSISATADGGLIAAFDIRNYQSLIPFFYVKYGADGCDTTVEYCRNSVGIKKLSPDSYRDENEKLIIFPQPAGEQLFLRLETGTNQFSISDFNSFQIYNGLGILVREEEITIPTEEKRISVSDLPEGMYLLQLKSKNEVEIGKRFIISR